MKKRITSKDIADLAGVSRTTVSFVLNNVPGMRIPEETRQRVLEAARRLDYQPHAAARSMASGRTHVLGIVVRQSIEQAFADLFLPQVLLGLAHSAEERGYYTLFRAIDPTTPNGVYSNLIRQRHVDGIILSGPRFDDQDLLYTHSAGLPIVLMGQLPNIGIPFVDVDNVGGAAKATQHLISLGHAHIAIVTNAPLEYTASHDRLTGYRQALLGAGLRYDEALVRHADLTPQGGQRAMNELLALPDRPTAVFVASDTVALGALQAIRNEGLHIPQDIAVVGYDDIPLSAYIEPPLTTMRLPAYGLGWEAAEMLVRRIEGEDLSHADVLLDMELVVRESCGAHLTRRTS
ncbi:MAG TPA: LacI family DNA-binding transcriptional regulator [Aggregatilineales bacterium]|nr:LacI family DNA-binding transcriptional regulator [Aggregatilineales bacterium]